MLGDSTLPRIEYDRLTKPGGEAIRTDRAALPEWGEWKTMDGRFRLGRRYSRLDLGDEAPSLIASGADSPKALGQLSIGELH